MRWTVAVLLAWSLTPALARAAPPAASKKVRVAVMALRPIGTEQVQVDLLSEVVLTEAAGFKALETIGRSDVQSILGLERQKQALGCAEDSACLAELGGALGVDYLVVGSIGRLGALYRVDLALIDQHRARVLGRAGASVTGEEAKLVAAVQQAVRELLGPVAGAGPAAAPPAPSLARFDGGWVVSMVCPDESGKGGPKGYGRRFDAAVAQGVFTARYGTPGAPTFLKLDGRLEPDGTADLAAEGLTGRPEYSTNRIAQGAAYAFRVKAQFGERVGSGTRFDRPCTFTFTRK